MTVEGALSSNGGQIILNDAAADTVSIASLTDGSSLDAVASGSLNDKLGGDLNAFNDAISITNGAEGTTLVMKEGLVAGEKTAQLTEEGKIDETTVTEKTNSVMESSLEMAASMPLAMNRILTNDVRRGLAFGVGTSVRFPLLSLFPCLGGAIHQSTLGRSRNTFSCS